MAGDEEVEAVARALFDLRTNEGIKPPVSLWPPDDGEDADDYRLEAREAIAALDRVRSRPTGSTTGGTEDENQGPYDFPGPPDLPPVPDTEGEDHEAAIEAALDAYWTSYRVSDSSTTFRDDMRAAIDAYLSHTPSPVSGTEPDTAKIVVWRCPECRLLSENFSTQPHRPGCSLDGKGGVKLEPAYAGFSVDAGKPEEER